MSVEVGCGYQTIQGAIQVCKKSVLNNIGMLKDGEVLLVALALFGTDGRFLSKWQEAWGVE